MNDLFCVASGPSLTKDDCDLVSVSGADILTVNDTWKLIPSCDYLYAGDYKWWNANAWNIPKSIKKISSSRQAANKFKAIHHIASGAFNSGMRSIMWAMEAGYKKIFLLGYDCSIKNGVHWHGLHDLKKGLTNPDQNKVEAWFDHYMKVYARAGMLGVEITNCSRYTELTCFKKASLEQVLGIKNKIENNIEMEIETWL